MKKINDIEEILPESESEFGNCKGCDELRCYLALTVEACRTIAAMMLVVANGRPSDYDKFQSDVEKVIDQALMQIQQEGMGEETK